MGHEPAPHLHETRVAPRHARAEALPFPAESFDAAVLTVHHRDDAVRGLRELRRASAAEVVLTWDLALRDEAELRGGLARLADDLESGAWRARNVDLLGRTELDLGYRLVVAATP